MKVNQSLLVKASILLVLSLSFIHAQWGIPFGSGFGGFPQQQQPYGFGGGNPFSTGGLGAGSPFSFDQPYSLPFGSNIGQNYPNYGGYGQNPYGQNQNYPNYGGYGQNPYGNNNQPNNNQNNNMRLRFAGQVYGYNPFYYVANLVAVDLDYISHFASALTNTGYQGYNPFYDPINGMNMMGNQNQQQKQNQPASNTATTGNNPSTTNTGTGNTASQADTQKANQEALALVFAKEVQIHVSHLVKQQDSYGPKGVGSLTTQLVDSADKLVTAANAKKWNDYQQEYSNLNNGLNKISYYGMQQNMPSFNQIPSSFQPPNWPNQNQQQQGTGSDANSGNVKGSSFFPFLGNNGQFTMPQAPQAPTIPEIPQQFANMQQQLPKQFSFPDMPQMPQIPQMQQQLPKQFSFPDMPQMPQIPQMQQVPQVINQQKTY